MVSLDLWNWCCYLKNGIVKSWVVHFDQRNRDLQIKWCWNYAMEFYTVESEFNKSPSQLIQNEICYIQHLQPPYPSHIWSQTSGRERHLIVNSEADITTWTRVTKTRAACNKKYYNVQDTSEHCIAVKTYKQTFKWHALESSYVCVLSCWSFLH